MNFENFVTVYNEDMKHRLREHTFLQKQYVINKKLLPFFWKMAVSEITPAHVRKWQNGLITHRDDKGNPLFSDIPPHHKQPACGYYELCRPLLQPKREPMPQGRNHRKRPCRRNELLDFGRI